MPHSPRILNLPCKACGQWHVTFLIAEPFGSFGPAGCDFCWSAHDLDIFQSEYGWVAAYDRNVLRYPEEHDGKSLPFFVRFKAPRTEDDDGPIMLAKRKSYFSAKEVADIWHKTNGWCHLCSRTRWHLEQRGVYGWHIDHVKPNIGGLAGTELSNNFRVACASCNLRKGKGYRHRDIRDKLTIFMAGWQALYKGQVVGSSPTAPTTSLRRQGLAAVKLPGSPRDRETENRGNSSRAAPC